MREREAERVRERKGEASDRRVGTDPERRRQVDRNAREPGVAGRRVAERTRVGERVNAAAGESIDAVQKSILESLARESSILKAPAPIVEVDNLGPISTTLTVHAWVRNSNYLVTLSDIKKRVREALQGAEVSAPVPVAAPAVAPWTPANEQPRENKKPN